MKMIRRLKGHSQTKRKEDGDTLKRSLRCGLHYCCYFSCVYVIIFVVIFLAYPMTLFCVRRRIFFCPSRGFKTSGASLHKTLARFSETIEICNCLFPTYLPYKHISKQNVIYTSFEHYVLYLNQPLIIIILSDHKLTFLSN
jgi:hypothetical protein